jgi:hypothetical protein
VFVEVNVEIPLGLAEAGVALDRALNDGGLIAESQRAYEDGLTFLMRVGPHGARGLAAKQVRVRVLPVREVGTALTAPLRWEATGPAGRLFPTLDANLTLTEADRTTSVLTLIGAYTPPMGRLGPALDETLLSSVASRTFDALLREVADKLRALA